MTDQQQRHTSNAPQWLLAFAVLAFAGWSVWDGEQRRKREQRLLTMEEHRYEDWWISLLDPDTATIVRAQLMKADGDLAATPTPPARRAPR